MDATNTPKMSPTNHVREAAIGIAATGGGTIVSLLPQIEAWVRLASVTVGLFIGLIVLAKQLRSWNRPTEK
jgi:hypothetical protein